MSLPLLFLREKENPLIALLVSEAVRQIFNNISPTYDRLNHILSLNFDKSWRQKTISQILKAKNEKFFALDLCAGTHDLGLECARQFPNSQIKALDFSEDMLRQGREKISHLKDQIESVCGDALKTPFADQSFDVIFCGFGVRNFDNTEKGIQEIRRLLKPEGQLLVLEFFRPTSKLNLFFNKTYAQNILPLFGKWISGNKDAYSYLRDSIRGFLTVPEFCELLQKNGFKNIKVKDYFLRICSCVNATIK